MTPVQITLRAREADTPPLHVEGHAPDADCPLAVTIVHVYCYASKTWKPGKGFCISHRPTGYQLAGKSWDTRQEAFETLLRCDPTFAAWPLATGRDDCAATAACKYKFRVANGTT